MSVCNASDSRHRMIRSYITSSAHRKWHAAPSTWVGGWKSCRCVRDLRCFVLWLLSFTLKMEGAYFSETSVHFCQTTRRCSSENGTWVSNLHDGIRRCWRAGDRMFTNDQARLLLSEPRLASAAWVSTPEDLTVGTRPPAVWILLFLSFLFASLPPPPGLHFLASQKC